MGPDQTFIEKALRLIDASDFDKALLVLTTAVDQMPADWRPIQRCDEQETVYCWDTDEFMAFAEYRNSGDDSAGAYFTEWFPGSYSHACYLAAFIHIERREFSEGLRWLDRGLTLEPNHPELLCEKAHVFQCFGRCEDALNLFEAAQNSRPWITDQQKARAIRGQAVCLIDLNRLDEAERALLLAKEIEPENPRADQELAYIRDLRSQRTPELMKLWPALAALNPPTDPLTCRLLEEVKDLPSIPGPDTVGLERFHSLSDAFKSGGWNAFEVEFAKLYPPDSSGRDEIKAKLLREPIFRPVFHENFAVVMSTYLAQGREAAIQLYRRLLRTSEAKIGSAQESGRSPVSIEFV